MANTGTATRPLSPHLSIWKWGPHMLVSIVHRVAGSGMATVGTALFVWWLVALAGGEKSYAQFIDVFTVKSGALNILGWIFGVGLTWAFFQHLATGVRHLVLDTGALFELKANKRAAILTMVFSVVATAGFWLYLIKVK